MSCDEKDCKVSVEEVVEEVVVKKNKRQYLPNYIEYNKKYYHKNVTPVTCDICGSNVVNRALYSHKKSNQCTLVNYHIEIERLKHQQATSTET